MAYETGDVSRIALCHQAARRALDQDVVWPGHELSARVGLAWAAVVGGDTEEARGLYDQLAEIRQSHSLGYSLQRVLGIIAAENGEHSRAARHFQQAVETLRADGTRPELGWTCLHYGILLRDQLDDAAGAVAMLAEAGQIADDLEMRPLAERVAREFGGGERHTRPAGLTEREVAVLQLVAQGLANKEVAAELGIATNTVAVHLRNIFDKTGAKSRTEAAMFATRHGLAS